MEFCRPASNYWLQCW